MVLARIRQQYEAGVPVAKIEGAKGHSGNWIYALASAGHWKRGATPTAPKPAPTGEHLRGRVRCPSCESMTEWDPCEHCHKAIKFKG